MEVVGSESEDEEGRPAPRTSGGGPALGTVGAAGPGGAEERPRMLRPRPAHGFRACSAPSSGRGFKSQRRSSLRGASRPSPVRPLVRLLHLNPLLLGLAVAATAAPPSFPACAARPTPRRGRGASGRPGVCPPARPALSLGRVRAGTPR